MIKKRIPILISALLINGTINASEQKLIFFKDFAHYKEKSEIDLSNKTYIELSDTAVLESVNVQIFNKEGKRLNLKSLEIMEQSESNIFKVNKDLSIYINEKEYTLISNGGDFIKVLDKNSKITYIPKVKIENMSFEKDINGRNHLVKINGFNNQNNINIEHSYTMGNISWKPKYNLYLLDDNEALLDYNIQVSNKTNRDFKNVGMTFISEPITRYYRTFSNSENDLIFNVKNNKEEKPIPIAYKRQYESKTFMSDQLSDSYNAVNHTIESGKRVLNFKGNVDIPANTDNSFSYLKDKKLKYLKENNFNFRYNLKNQESIEAPILTIRINREKVQHQTPLSQGVIRIFSDKNNFKNKLIQENILNEKQKNEELLFNIGNNYNINIKSILSNSKYDLSQNFTLIGSGYNKDVSENNKKSRFDYKDKKHINIRTIEFETNSTDISPSEVLNVNLNDGRYFTDNEDLIKQIKLKILNENKLFTSNDIEGEAREKYNIFKKEITNKLKTKIKYNENDLKNNKSIKIYLVSI